jgi:hypothetical protein
MFGLFKKSSKEIKVVDKVWLSKQAKWNACAQMVKLDPSVLLVCWFDETVKEMESSSALAQNLVKAENVTYDKTVGKMVVFAEHFPLASAEQELFANLQLTEVPVLNALDEPIFMLFGGENTIEIMKKLGVGDDEIIGHSMITKSIRRAQEKIEEKSGTNYPARSAQEWLSLNLKSAK